jgi:hypothetical protein
MKKTLLTTGSIMSFLIAHSAHAFCPVCTIAVGAGLGLTQEFGIDDTISGLWIGGLIVSMSMWTLSWLEKRRFHFDGKKFLVPIGYYALVIAPLYAKGVIGHPLNTLWGIDKLILGIVLGSFVFFGGGMWYESMKRKNGGHAHFPYQKIVMPIAPLILLSVVFYFITK